MVASLSGLDVLAFTGGVGEHLAEIRAQAILGLGFLGLQLDDRLNAEPNGDREITGAGATARTFVVRAREDIEIAHQARAVLGEGSLS
jgi:acetate kinase